MQTPDSNPKPKKKKPQGPIRAYKGSDADMLTCGLVICDHAIFHQLALAGRRSRLTLPFIGDLRTDIAKALQKDLGIDPKAALLAATNNVTSAGTKIRDLFSDFYQDLRDGYAENKPRLNTISTALGFIDLYDAVRNNNQQAIGQLLAQFDQNMTPELLAELTDPDQADISATLIADIRAHSNFSELNVTQEGLKGTGVAITAEQIEKFNALYRRFMNIARLGRSLFRDQPALADKFSYSVTRRKLRGGQITRPTPTP